MNTKLSVIVPVYKVENYLTKCIDSILKQTYYNLEIILVDDGSPDQCGNICDEYSKIDNRIKVIHKENGGLSDARNVGISVATGEFITFVDSDDWIEPNMYEILMQGAIKYGTKLSVGGVKVYDESKKKYRKQYDEIIPDERVLSKIEYLKSVFLGIWAAWDKIYHKSLFEKIRFPKNEFNEDEAIMVDIIEQCPQIFITNQPLYVHCVREKDSLTAACFSEKKIDWYKHCVRNHDLIKKKYPEITQESEYRYLTSLIWCLNNMTQDKKRYGHRSKVLQKDLRSNIKPLMTNIYLPLKEKFRGIIMCVAYRKYVLMVNVLGKKYT